MQQRTQQLSEEEVMSEMSSGGGVLRRVGVSPFQQPVGQD